MKRILFQGDSITDCSRNRNDFYEMGRGYPNFVKGALGLEHPDEYEFINRGNSGDRVVDLYERIAGDFIALRPDYLSIYIGVNDAWRLIDRDTGIDTATFERVYTALIDEIRAACPDVKIIIIAPFVVEGTATCNTDEFPDRWERFKEYVAEKAEASRRLAEKYGFAFIELQPVFDEACTKAPASYWTVDGVHPTACGHEIIKRLWIEAFEIIK